MVHREEAKQTALFIPLPANSVHPAIAITQFLGQLAIEMPGSVKTVELPIRYPNFLVDASVTIIKPLYAKFRHVSNSTDTGIIGRRKINICLHHSNKRRVKILQTAARNHDQIVMLPVVLDNAQEPPRHIFLQCQNKLFLLIFKLSPLKRIFLDPWPW